MNVIRDTYKNFEELSSSHAEGDDYTIEVRDRNSSSCILAIHGGAIETGTAELAADIASQDISLYVFRGLTGKDESTSALKLHITSHHFDEPRCLSLVATTKKTLSIHGQHDRENSYTMIGGLDNEMIRDLHEALISVGIDVRESSSSNPGTNPLNIINRNQKGAGAQLEISRKLREDLSSNTQKRLSFLSAVREVLLE